MLSARLVLASLAASSLVAWAGSMAACGSAEDTTAGAAATDAGSDGRPKSDSGIEPEDAAPTPIPANGIVLVHAAQFPAFRICIEGDKSRTPIPSTDLMPDSNVPGVDVGSVVRMDPLETTPGKIWAFAVDDIKGFYKADGTGPSCSELLGGSSSNLATEVADLSDDLSSGVHLLVLRGSKADQTLAMEKITLPAYPRFGMTTIPVQVVPLSTDVTSRDVAIAFGNLGSDAGDAGDAGALVTFVNGVLPFGETAPVEPYPLAYNPNDEAAYASRGFVVSRGAADAAATDAGDAGLQVVLVASLADVQGLSAPRSLPAEYFAAASSYVLLLLGSADVDASDERARLHLLAVPLKAPVIDAGVLDASLD